MKEKFITAKGRVEVEHETLFVKTVKFYFFDSAFARIFLAVLPPVGLTYLVTTYDHPRNLFRIVLWVLFTITALPELYRMLVKKSFANRIPLRNIVHFETAHDRNGLETHVVLHLRSGRQRTLTFRTLEKQYEAFTNFLSTYATRLHMAEA